MSDTKIPLVNLAWQHEQVAERIREGFDRVLARTAFIGGPDIADFEAAFAAYCEVSHCIGVANGTDALEMGLRALDIGPGDEVLVPANTFIASALAVVRAGATPVFVDSDPRFHLIDSARVEERIGPHTRAIMPVHLYGQIAPMTELTRIADARGLHLVEDAAQAQGARQGGRAIGAWGAATGISFYPGKNLGAYGDAGCVLATDDGIATDVRMLRSYGGRRKFEHEKLGFNSRLDTLQAVVLNAKLPELDAWNEMRRTAAARYDALLGGLEAVTLPETVPGNEHVWHLYVVRVPNRDAVLERLVASGIGASIHYPQPLHLTGAFRSLGHGPGDFPVAEKAAGEILSLPLSPGLTAQQQARVAAALASALEAS